MRLSHFIAFPLAVMFFSCDNDDYPHAAIPSVVLNEFWTKYPRATDVDFRKVGELYEVEFEVKGNDVHALIAVPGIILKEKKEVSFRELPGEVQEALEKFGKEKIKAPEVVKTGKGIYYQARIKRFWFDEKVVLNSVGSTQTNIEYWD